MFTEFETVYPEYNQNKISQYKFNRNRNMENRVSRRFNDLHANAFLHERHHDHLSNENSRTNYSHNQVQKNITSDTDEEKLFFGLGGNVDIQSIANPLLLKKNYMNANLLAASQSFFPSSISLNMESIEDPFDDSKLINQNKMVYTTSQDPEWYQCSVGASSENVRAVSDISIHARFDDILSSSDTSSNISLSATPETSEEYRNNSNNSINQIFPIEFGQSADAPVQLPEQENPISKQKAKSKTSSKKLDKKDSEIKEEMRCTNCETTNTPLWRKDVDRKPLCNACGLFLKLHGVMRPLSLKTDVIKKRQRTSKMSANSNLSTNSKLKRRRRRVANKKRAELKVKKSAVKETLPTYSLPSKSSSVGLLEETSAVNQNFNSMTLEDKLPSNGINRDFTYNRSNNNSPSTISENNIGFNHDFALPWTGNDNETKMNGVDDVTLGYAFGLMDEHECFDTFQI